MFERWMIDRGYSFVCMGRRKGWMVDGRLASASVLDGLRVLMLVEQLEPVAASDLRRSKNQFPYNAFGGEKAMAVSERTDAERHEHAEYSISAC